MPTAPPRYVQPPRESRASRLQAREIERARRRQRRRRYCALALLIVTVGIVAVAVIRQPWSSHPSASPSGPALVAGDVAAASAAPSTGESPDQIGRAACRERG